MRYTDNIGIIYFTNQNSLLHSTFHYLHPEVKEARAKIKKALFEKAEEL
jgi:hypothetical protein